MLITRPSITIEFVFTPKALIIFELSPVALMAKPFSVPKNHQSISITTKTATIPTTKTAVEVSKPILETIDITVSCFKSGRLAFPIILKFTE